MCWGIISFDFSVFRRLLVPSLSVDNEYADQRYDNGCRTGALTIPMINGAPMYEPKSLFLLPELSDRVNLVIPPVW